jgi:NADH-ubiquinone oxidoreductase chain 4
MYLFLFLTLYMFRAHRERQILSTQPLVTVTLFTVGGRVVCRSEVAHGLCSSGLFCLSNISYERFGRRSLLVNKGLINLMPRLAM